MSRNRIFLTIGLALLVLSPAVTLAVVPVDQYDGGGDSGSYTPPPPSNSKINFRTCFDDRDIGLVLAEAKNPGMKSPAKDDRTPTCDHIQYECLFSVRVDCTETPQGYSWKCINYSYDYDGNGFDAATRDVEGAQQTQCSIPKKKLNGKCSTERNKCSIGMVDNIASSTDAYVWTCFGEGGGTNDQCEEKIPQVVDGKCGRTHYLCSKGTVASSGDNGKEWIWKCLGENEGITASCSEVKPFKGVCGSKYYTCSAGTSTRQTKYTEKWMWACEGVGTGSVTSCSQDRVQAGVCSTSVANKCDEGYPIDPKTTATANTWSCSGVGGAASVSCSKNLPPQNGVCSSSHYRCAKGEGVSKIATTDVWSWVCPGILGGTSASCTETMGVKKGSCSSEKNKCNIGTPTGMSESEAGYKWTCIGPNNGGNVSCEVRKKTEGMCADTKDACISGDLIPKSESRTMFNWSCKGVAGGGSETCSFPKATSSVTAICSKEHYSCAAGRATNKAESKINWSWICDGGVGGTNANCSENKPPVTPPEDPGKSTSTPPTTKDEIGTCSLTDTACLLKQCKGNSVCEDTVKKCVKGEVNCVENFIIVPGVKEPFKTGSCALNDMTCLTKQCTGSLSCEDVIKSCSSGNSTCVKNLIIEKNITKNPEENKKCLLTDTQCLIKQCKGNLVCEDTVKKCVKGEVNCVEDFKIISGVKEPFKTGSCALNDLSCLTKQCKENIVCEDTIKQCSSGSTACVKDLVIDKGTQIDGKNDACAVDDLECLIKKCNGNLACINALKQCKSNDITCIEDSLTKAGTSIAGPVTQAEKACAPKDLQCLLRKCNGNLACESALRKCKLTDTKCINAALLKRNVGWGPGYKENNGTCAKDAFSCVYGTNYDNVRDANGYKWSCVGKNGGYDSVCMIQNPKDAVCSTKVHNTCEIGKPTKISETSSVWNWTCNGVGTGKAAACSMNIVPLDGVCSDKVQSCNEGKVSLFRVNGDWNEWVCSGSYGGKSTDCFREVKGSCSLKRYACDSGTADAKSETDLGYGWKCRGANGDLTVSCFEKKPLPEQSKSTTTPEVGSGSSTKSNLNKAVSSAAQFVKSKIVILSMAVDNLLAII